MRKGMEIMIKAKRLISYALIGVMALSVSGCGKNSDKSESDAGAALVNVKVSEVKTGDVDETVSYTGEIKAESTASVSAKVSGSVKSLNAKVGDYVKAGSVLMTIDSSQYTLAYNQALAAYQSAQAAMEGAQAAVNSAHAAKKSAQAAQSGAQASYNNVADGSTEQSKINMEQAVANARSAYDTALDSYNRMKALYDIGAISKVELDASQTALNNAKVALDTATANATVNESVVIPQTKASAGAGLSQADAGVNQAQAGITQAEAGITQAQAGINQAKAALDVAKNNLSNCTVTAPISGYITSANASIGQMASPGIELFGIKNTDDVEIEINVTESVIPFITQATKATVNIKSAGLKDMEGVISAVSNAKSDTTGMYLVKVSIPNSDGKIKVGMLADVSLVTSGAKDTLVADSNALILKNDKYYVYVAQGEKAVKKEVTIGVTDGKKTQILTGLSEGDKVIVDGKDFLSEKNNSIRIVK